MVKYTWQKENKKYDINRGIALNEFGIQNQEIY